MADTTSMDSANQVLNAFMNRKKTRDNAIALEAQRLVNLFRQLSVLKPEFVADYNKMLLSASDEVHMMIKDIVGGPSVRQYLEYLQAKAENKANEPTEEEDVNSDENKPTFTMNSGYLPSPDEDNSFKIKSADNPVITDTGQSEIFIQALTSFQENNQKQIEVLTEALQELKQQFQNRPIQSETASVDAITHNDLLQYQTNQQKFFEQLMKQQAEKSSADMVTHSDLLQYQEKQQKLFEELVKQQTESISAITAQLATIIKAQQTPVIIREVAKAPASFQEDVVQTPLKSSSQSKTAVLEKTEDFIFTETSSNENIEINSFDDDLSLPDIPLDFETTEIENISKKASSRQFLGIDEASLIPDKKTWLRMPFSKKSTLPKKINTSKISDIESKNEKNKEDFEITLDNNQETDLIGEINLDLDGK